MAAMYDSPESLKGLYTCLACQIGFHSADLQRQHYRTDWYPLLKNVSHTRHRYNLKRKVAELPPVTTEVFAQKVLGCSSGDIAYCSATRSAEIICLAGKLYTDLCSLQKDFLFAERFQ